MFQGTLAANRPSLSLRRSVGRSGPLIKRCVRKGVWGFKNSDAECGPTTRFLPFEPGNFKMSTSTSTVDDERRAAQNAASPSTSMASASAPSCPLPLYPTAAPQSLSIYQRLSGYLATRRAPVVLLCFVAFILCNLDRVNMSIAVIPLAAQHGWTSTQMGLVQSSFFWGYLATQILGGLAADKYGGKLVLGCAVVWWSLATALTPLAASLGFNQLLIARALMGLGEGAAMPSMNSMVSEWVPKGERSRSLAFIYSGMYLGSMVGLYFSPRIIEAFGWPALFTLFGSLGLVWALFWGGKTARSPSSDPLISESERALLSTTPKSGSAPRVIPWRPILKEPAVWAIIIAHFMHNFTFFILLTWTPLYLSQHLGLSLLDSGAACCLPWLFQALGGNLAGSLADSLIARGTPTVRVRKGMQAVGFLGPAVFLLALSTVTDPVLAVACLVGAQFCDAFSQAGLYSNHQDIGPRYAGVLLGLSNTAGVFAGVVCTTAVGLILQHGTWMTVWVAAAGASITGALVYSILAKGEKIFD